MNVRLSQPQRLLLEKYSSSVAQAPSWLGLTSAGDRNHFWERHIEDALAFGCIVESFAPQGGGRLIDVGTGNGIPGIVLAISHPAWNVDLLDSDNKKIGFVESFCKFNGINNVTFLPMRAEEFGRNAGREKYDIIVARALAKLPTVLELTSPLVKVGGAVIVSHGTKSYAAIEDSKHAAQELSLSLTEIRNYGLSMSYVSLIFKKIGTTADLYPRAVGVPSKHPLT